MALTQVNAGLIDSTSQPNSFKNRIINGAMMIDQRNAGASFTPTTSLDYTLDRWRAVISVASKFSVQQNAGSVTPPAGFTKYMGITSTSAYSVGAADYFSMYQIIEGFNVADLAWGTASASPVTLSFWVRSSLTGTFGGSVKNAATRSYPFTYTISSANTWEQKSITIAGDTTGTWNTDNSGGLYLSLALGIGSTYSGAAGTWAGTNYLSATGATSVVGTNGATFYITGVQLEKGSTATSFDYRPYGTELALCQRYYEKSYSIDVVLGTVTSAGQVWGSRQNGAFVCPARFSVSKRASPTITSYSPTTGTSGKLNNAQSGSDENASITDQGTSAFNNSGATGNISDALRFQWTASAEL